MENGGIDSFMLEVSVGGIGFMDWPSGFVREEARFTQ
uniref:Uncharacterized protein n=1 Tax=Manihot esculenta TaxID=3983 RepID=A0A2C9W288_MANES